MEFKKQFQALQQTVPCQSNPPASDAVHQRRSANYKPNIWNYDYLDSLSSIYDVRMVPNYVLFGWKYYVFCPKI